jgi:hypothetical protein
MTYIRPRTVTDTNAFVNEALIRELREHWGDHVDLPINDY